MRFFLGRLFVRRVNTTYPFDAPYGFSGEVFMELTSNQCHTIKLDHHWLEDHSKASGALQ